MLEDVLGVLRVELQLIIPPRYSPRFAIASVVALYATRAGGERGSWRRRNAARTSLFTQRDLVLVAVLSAALKTTRASMIASSVSR